MGVPYPGPMKVITGTGLVLLAAFIAGLFTGVWWLIVGPVAGVLTWSVLSDRTTKWSGWTTEPRSNHHREGVRWTSRP